MTTPSSPPVRVRFAPSPTGFFHVGGARTALYNWLFARRHGGVFVLRIEDTDAERSAAEMTDAILRDMQWLGLDWDEGPYHQSQRRARHEEAVQKLLGGGHAYPCFCPKEWLDGQKEEAQKAGRAYRYDKRCRGLSAAQREEKISRKIPFTVRVKTPEGEDIHIRDMVLGDITIAAAECDDFIIARSDGSPIYNLAVVVDDIDMRISHVIRGNEHLSNTPKQILLYRALGHPLPVFAHLPLILGKDKKKLSKRHGATSVGEFRRMGYLPEAMMNYLALLGWSPGDDREFLRKAELIEAFSAERINQSGAIFDEDKFLWLNGQYISAYSARELWGPLRDALQEAGLWSVDFDGERRAWLEARIDLLKSRARTVVEFVKNLRPFLSDDFPYDEEAVKKRLKTVRPEQVRALAAAFSEASPFEEKTLEEALRVAAEKLGVKGGDLIHPMRIALTGQMVGPSAFAVVEAVGREKTLERLERMAKFLERGKGETPGEKGT
jgi:glutamyl-tRNA synthetase